MQLMLNFWQLHTYLWYPTNRNQVTLSQRIVVDIPHFVYILPNQKFLDSLTPEIRTNNLSRNVDKRLPIVILNPRRVKT